MLTLGRKLLLLLTLLPLLPLTTLHLSSTTCRLSSRQPSLHFARHSPQPPQLLLLLPWLAPCSSCSLQCPRACHEQPMEPSRWLLLS